MEHVLIVTYNILSSYLIHIVNCEWNAWEPYSTCSVTCGEGTKTKKRTKSVEESGEGTCAGKNQETISCYKDECTTLGTLILLICIKNGFVIII